MRGVTLAELALGLSILGVLVGIGVPRVVTLRDRLAVERQAGAILTAYHQARLAAITRGQLVRLSIAPSRLAVHALQAADSVLLWEAEGPAADGVELVSAPAPAVFAPSGVTMGVANGRYVLRRGDIVRTLVASRLGRLRVSRPRRRRRSTPRARRYRDTS